MAFYANQQRYLTISYLCGTLEGNGDLLFGTSLSLSLIGRVPVSNRRLYLAMYKTGGVSMSADSMSSPSLVLGRSCNLVFPENKKAF